MLVTISVLANERQWTKHNWWSFALKYAQVLPFCFTFLW